MSPTQFVRGRVLRELHLGHLRAGDRLPTVRDLSRELDVDHRAVAQAYHRLETEGLVEVRGRTGVYVAKQERLGGELPSETARWLAGVLSEARQRRITIPNFPDFVKRCTAQSAVRCACIESTLDQMTTLVSELADEFGMQPSPVFVDSLPTGNSTHTIHAEALPEELLQADLLVTTVFHAEIATRIARALRKPIVVATVNPELGAVIGRRLRQGPLTAIVVDPAYGERLRSIYDTADDESEPIRIVLADDAPAIARLDRFESVLVTRAARQRLADLDIPLLLPRYPSMSAESGQEITEHLIRLNMEAGPDSAAAPNQGRS
ncbi:MAG: GntR family transcriptional regulator [Gemmatimonadota bacterium]|nr:GntR family transcriptional regulator [Gemmatimonadota bacterium]